MIAVDTTEYMFKQALIQKKFSQVLRMVREYNLIGQAIIAYLQKKGYPEVIKINNFILIPKVALHFVKDEKTRFNLALECGNIEVALESAKVLDSTDSWHRLGVEALRQGNHQIVEMAYQRTKNYERLSFLYLITGNTDKLKKMLKISEMRKDPMSRFHNALFLGDISERVRLLEEVGQLTIAYITARTHNLEEQATDLASKLEQAGQKIPPINESAQLLLPPIPIMRLHETNWPLLTVSKGYFDNINLEEERPKFSATVDPEELGEADWGDMDLDEEGTGEQPEKPADLDLSLDEEGGTWDINLELGDELNSIEIAPKSEKSFVMLPQQGQGHEQLWTQSSLAADHCAAGSFDTALRLLQQQVGAVNFAPLKSHALGLFQASQLRLSTLPSLPSLAIPLLRAPNLPRLTIGLQQLIDNRLKTAYRATTAGKFNDALSHFTYILHALLFVVVESKKEANEVKKKGKCHSQAEQRIVGSLP